VEHSLSFWLFVLNSDYCDRYSTGSSDNGSNDSGDRPSYCNDFCDSYGNGCGDSYVAKIPLPLKTLVHFCVLIQCTGN